MLQKLKHHTKITIIFFFTLLAMQSTTLAQKSKISSDIDSVMAELKDDNFSGNVLVAERGKVVYEKSFGYADTEKNILLNKNSIFLIGSVAKTLTATAVLKLKEQGKLKLEDSITKYFPELNYKTVTLRHLLTHTSGILEYQSEEIIKEIAGKSVNNAELVKVFARRNPKLIFEAGTKWDYSNTNYVLLALIVEKVSGKSFANFVQDNIFAPARMTSSFVLLENVPENLKKEIADGYRLTNPLAVAPVSVETLDGARQAFATKRSLYGAGNVYSTAGDLLKFHRALQDGKILKKKTLAEMYAAEKLSTNENYHAFTRTNYPAKNALGWFAADDESNGKIVYHPGGDIGYTSYFLRNVSKDQTVIILSNVELLRHYTPTALLKILNGESFKTDLKSLANTLGREYNRHGAAAMLKIFGQFKTDEKYNFSEDEINELGYRLLYDKKDSTAALEIFKINAEKFSASYNVWDSLGEIYYQTGDIGEAIKNYEKSLQLNPKNEGGRRMLERIRRGEKP